MKDVRKEQLVLLRFEKQLVALAAAVAAGASAAKAADGKLGTEEAAAAFAGIQSAVLHLAEVTGAAHAALNARAIDAGVRMLEATGGTPKHEPFQGVASIFGIG